MFDVAPDHQPSGLFHNVYSSSLNVENREIGLRPMTLTYHPLRLTSLRRPLYLSVLANFAVCRVSFLPRESVTGSCGGLLQTKRWHDRGTMKHIISPVNCEILGPLVECIRMVRLTSKDGVKCSPNLLVLVIALIVSPTGPGTGARRSAESEFPQSCGGHRSRFGAGPHRCLHPLPGEVLLLLSSYAQPRTSCKMWALAQSTSGSVECVVLDDLNSPF